MFLYFLDKKIKSNENTCPNHTWISRRFSLLAMLPTSISILLISCSFSISTLLLRDLSASPTLRNISTEAERVSLPLTRCSAIVWTTKRASVARRISSCNTNILLKSKLPPKGTVKLFLIKYKNFKANFKTSIIIIF